MSANESPRAANTGALDVPSQRSPQGSIDYRESTVTSAGLAIAAADEAHYLRLLADILARTHYRGLGLDGRPFYTDNGGRQRYYLTRRAIRPLVSDQVSNLVVDRIVADLAKHAADLQTEIDDIVIARTVDRACDLDDDADDAELLRQTHQLHLELDIDKSVRRHPAGRRYCRTGGVR